MRSKLIFTGCLVLVLGTALQVLSLGWLGWSADFVLIALLAFGPWARFKEFILFLLIGAAVLSWRPGVSYEILLVAGVPLFFFAVEKIFPWHVWINFIISLILGTVVFYLLLGQQMIFLEWAVLLKVLFLNLLWGSALFIFLGRKFAPRGERMFV